mmetsp:Transcript_6040/g.13150  ORF Transcript_6040/g.13150 Transcript_6040/m.13150 type:complete len:472 (-) Transcript_6040:1142-2557(-)
MKRISETIACVAAASAALVSTASAFSTITVGSIDQSRTPIAPSVLSTAPTMSLPAHGEGIDISQVEDVEFTEEEKAFFSRTKNLCEDRNLPFDQVKNARDLASVANSPVKPGTIYRMGRVSDATASDLKVLMDDIGIKTLIDLRSPTELKDDPTLEREEVFGNFTSVVWTERGGGRDGLVRELPPGEPRIKKKDKKERGTRMKDAVSGLKQGIIAATHDFRGVENSAAEIIVQVSNMEETATLEAEGFEENLPDEAFDDRCDLCGIDDDCLDRKERHFVSLMNEFKYVRGTLSKLRKRDIAGVLIRSPTAIVSKRARERVKDVFLEEINDGGLPLLNEFLLRFGAPGIKYVLELCADESRHPVAFYCTAGKDRTGMITAIILSLLGVPDEDIVEDYSLSANVYAEMNDHKAMVGALSQRNLDPKTFLGAPPQVMRDTLVAIRENYGDVEGYLDFIGFGPEQREQLKKAMLP